MANTTKSNTSTGLVMLLVALLIAVGAYAFFNMRENRTTAEKVGDAVSELPNGADNAARELNDRTPAERTRDAINDATDGTTR